ncbi:MAG TPA: CDP-alcohol phosphatidyltransferase family protein [Bacteroidales bacterium]|jgi:CDP-diacylglycerol--glycerol-3-phosphate 3-phosphatidyltransferase|nr:MAG: phosphatidylglycerophosphate synthetase [Bacteroidetes bacterium ADurb.Bin145]HOU00901.1 CDP-alcohol phosphatidyltransferase family protein [Bacteroidales bacterium]HQK66708.1 CDP-alcohol phosphatidyltransferase family protein [Bacteroidales bacterium]
MKRKEILTVPNMITIYRLLVFPLILFFALKGREFLFVIFLVINLLSDAIDGFLARILKQETEIGAKLDAFADNLTYLLAFTGIFLFKMEQFKHHLISFMIFMGFLILTVIISLIKFKKFPSFHLYSTKIGGYIQGAFIICLFTIDFITPFYYFTICWGILGAIEHIVIQFLIREMRSNVKGLYWILKEKRFDNT